MTATLTSCTLFKNADGSIDRYEIGFTSDIIPAGTLIPVVNIRASDVTDITNLNQVKVAALAKINLMEVFILKGSSQTSTDIPL